MKCTLVIILGLGTLSLSAQKLSAEKVPAAVRESFAKAFPAVTQVNWNLEKKDIYEAEFKEGGKSMSANFSSKGEWLETETEIKVADLPKPVADYLSQHYKGVHIKEAAQIKKSSGLIFYEAEVKGKDLLFDENGNAVKE